MNNPHKKHKYVPSTIYAKGAADLIFALEENATGVFSCMKNTKEIEDIQYIDADTVNKFLTEKNMKVLVLSEPRQLIHLKDKQRTIIARNWI